MANFNEAVLTKKGIALLAKAQAGQTSIKLTKAASGGGSYGADEPLVEKEALKEQMQEFPFDKMAVENSSTVAVKFTITNEQESGNLQAGYYVKEVGIFAEDPDEGEILYAIATTVEDQWDYMPAYSGLMPAYISVEFYVEVSNSASVTIVCAGRFITVEEVEAELTKLREDAETAHEAMRKEAKTAHDAIKKQIEDAGKVPDGVLTEEDKGVEYGVASLDYKGKLVRDQIPEGSGAVSLRIHNGVESCTFKSFVWEKVGDLDHPASTETGWVGVLTGWEMYDWEDIRKETCMRWWQRALVVPDYDWARGEYDENWADYYMSVFARLNLQAYFQIDPEGAVTIKIFSDSNLGEVDVGDIFLWFYAIRGYNPDRL